MRFELPNPYGALNASMRRCAFMLVYAATALLLMEYVFRPAVFIRIFPDASTAYDGLFAHLWWALGSISLYLPIPMLIIRFGFGQRLRDYGWHFALAARQWWLYGALLLAVLPLVFYAASRSDFLAVYPFYRGASMAQLGALLIWELAYLVQFLALEFFFRGFLVLGLSPLMGRMAVWVAMIPYSMIHYHKPLPEAFVAIMAGVFLGELAQRTRSIAGGVILHIGVALTMELLALGLL